MDKIKEGFDSLPIAVGFFDRNGMVRLVNHAMLAVMHDLRPDGVQTLAELDNALLNPPAKITRLDADLFTYRFSDGRVLQFTKEQITTKERMRYTQVTASDVTRLIQRQAELRKENKKLEKANDRLRKLSEQMPEIIREEETLQMKLRVHDDIGHSILASRRVLLKQAGLDELRASATLWEQSIAVLYRSNQMRRQADPIGETLEKVGEMGVHVLMEETIPEALNIRELLSLAIHECATNCVRHANGTKLYVQVVQDGKCTQLILTNDGLPPHENIREGGGLSVLRHRVEESGGSMKIESAPRFILTVKLPKK